MIGQIRVELAEDLGGLLDMALATSESSARMADGGLEVVLHREHISGGKELSIVVSADTRRCRELLRPFGDKLKVELAREVLGWLNGRNYRCEVDELRLRINFFFAPNNGIVVLLSDGHVVDRWGCHTAMPTTIAPREVSESQ